MEDFLYYIVSSVNNFLIKPDRTHNKFILDLDRLSKENELFFALFNWNRILFYKD